MTAPTVLRDRVYQWLMEDPDAPHLPYEAARVELQLAIEASRLANQQLLGQVTVVQAITGRALYPLDALGVLQATGTATGGSATTLVDSGVDFTTLGLTVGVSRVRDLTDGCFGLISAIAATTLTCDAGWTGGVTNAPVSGDSYLIEYASVPAARAVAIAHVAYNGQRLTYTTEAQLDTRRAAQGNWETWDGEPRYWLLDNATVPTELRIVPAPQRTGSNALVIPVAPFVLDWRDNLTVWYYEDAADVGLDTTGFAEAYDDLLVFATAGALAARQGEYENVALAQVMPALAALWTQALAEGL